VRERGRERERERENLPRNNGRVQPAEIIDAIMLRLRNRRIEICARLCSPLHPVSPRALWPFLFPRVGRLIISPNGISRARLRVHVLPSFAMRTDFFAKILACGEYLVRVRPRLSNFQVKCWIRCQRFYAEFESVILLNSWKKTNLQVYFLLEKNEDASQLIFNLRRFVAKQIWRFYRRKWISCNL